MSMIASRKQLNIVIGIALACIIGFFLFYRLHNTLAFNPYWGYDGGGHIDYIFSLALDHQFPAYGEGENDVAWHEPLYYFIMAAIAKIAFLFTDSQKLVLHTLGIVQSILSFSVIGLFSYLFWQISKNKIITLASTLLIISLPAFAKASTMLTNELLNYFFIALLFVYYFYLESLPAITKKHALILGLITGAALLTKITVIIPAIIIFAFLLFRLYKKQGAKFAAIFLTIALVPILIFEIPWQMHRSTFLENQTINNPSLLEPQPIKIDERVHFYFKFDTDIFRFPYWYSGGRAFWSMFYADSFYDYDNMMHNPDLLAVAPEGKRVQTTHNETYAPIFNLKMNKILVWTGLIPCMLMILGFIKLLSQTIKQKNRESFFMITVTMGFLAALLYFSYRYPYYDMGIVKSIFIFPIFLFPTIAGMQLFRGYAKAGMLTLLAILYILPSFIALWIPGTPY